MTATDAGDRFGAFGGRYVPETLIPALDDLELGARGSDARFGLCCRTGQICLPLTSVVHLH